MTLVCIGVCPTVLRKRGLKCIASWAVTALMLQLAFLIMIASLNFQGYVHRRNGLLHVPLFASYAAPGRAFDPAGSLFFVPTICHTISIFVLNSLYRKVGPPMMLTPYICTGPLD